MVALIWNMELSPDREAMGRYLMVPMRASRKKLPYSAGIIPRRTENMDRYTADSAMLGIR